jgi:hypothetical protein
LKKRWYLFIVVIVSLSICIVFAEEVPDNRPRERGRNYYERQGRDIDRQASARGRGNRQSPGGGQRGSGQGGRGSQSRGGNSPPAIFKTEVPKHDIDIILGRPTKNSITFNIVAYDDVETWIEYGTEKAKLTKHTNTYKLKNKEPLETVLSSLKPDTQYYYKLYYGRRDSKDSATTVNGRFHTHRPDGSDFTFVIQADSHIDINTEPQMYKLTLHNMLADRPDFLVDIGDTFMTGKARNYEPLSLYLAQRYYFGQACHSIPLFLLLGNHDGEPAGTDTTPVLLRKKYYPNPFPDSFYTGNEIEEKGIGLLENYYSWKWGNSLFVVLDPFWYTDRNQRGRDDNWYFSLGQAQYQWLKEILEQSMAPFKFVFIHHLVGGLNNNGVARGGAEAAKYFEWGGHSFDGNYDFKEKRPGWQMPIHDLLVKNNVSVVFHGHDHFFAKEELDGIIYQLVPQPGHTKYTYPRNAAEYGYGKGEVIGGSGYLRVKVSSSQAAVDFVRSFLPRDEAQDRKNGEIAYTYTISNSLEK